MQASQTSKRKLAALPEGTRLVPATVTEAWDAVRILAARTRALKAGTTDNLVTWTQDALRLKGLLFGDAQARLFIVANGPGAKATADAMEARKVLGITLNKQLHVLRELEGPHQELLEPRGEPVSPQAQLPF